MDTALIGVGGTILGTILGAVLTWLSSKDAAKDAREHQAAELIRQRREAAAVALSSELELLDDALPSAGAPANQQVPKLQQATGLLRRCEKRAAMIEDAGINERLRALGIALWVAVDEAEEKEGAGGVNIWSLGMAVGDLYAAVNAYQLRKPAPAAIFPSADELTELVGVDPGGMQKINHAARMSRVGHRKRRTA